MQNIAQVCIPSSHLKEDLKQVFVDADPLDLIHDIVFVVGPRMFAANRFILSANCNSFYQKACAPLRSPERDDKTFHVTEVPAEIFGLMLEFIYTGTCAIFEKEVAAWNLTMFNSEECSDQYINAGNDRSVADLKKIDNEKNSDDREGPWRLLRMVQFHAKNFGIHKLAEILEKV